MSGDEHKSKLGDFLREVSNWQWDEFVNAEHDQTYTTNQAVIFSLIRACYMQKLDAIKIALNRLDGKLKTPVRIELPKVYYLYPNAHLQTSHINKEQGSISADIHEKDKEPALSGELIPAPAPKDEPEPDLPSLSLRQTLSKMSDYPRDLPDLIMKTAFETEQWLRDRGPKPEENIPAVKSVVAAALLIMAKNRDINALTEVFDQIDGKLAETLQVLGEDIYITSYATEAPLGAYLNDEGIIEIEAPQSQELWANKLGGMKP